MEQVLGAAGWWEDSTSGFTPPDSHHLRNSYRERGSPEVRWWTAQITMSPASSHPLFLSPWVFPILSEAAGRPGGHMTLAVWS